MDSLSTSQAGPITISGRSSWSIGADYASRGLQLRRATDHTWCGKTYGYREQLYMLQAKLLQHVNNFNNRPVSQGHNIACCCLVLVHGKCILASSLGSSTRGWREISTVRGEPHLENEQNNLPSGLRVKTRRGVVQAAENWHEGEHETHRTVLEDQSSDYDLRDA